MGRFLILLGVVLIVVGLVVHLLPGQTAGRIPWLGRLPGDFVIKRENFSFYFPLASSLLLSVVLSVLFWLFRR